LFSVLFSIFPKKITGAENLKITAPYIIAANHASILDGFLVTLYLSKITGTYIHFLTKDKYFENPLFKVLLGISEGIKVAMKDPVRSFFSALKYLERGQIVGIFPESTRSIDGKIQKGKNGAAALVLKARVPLVPVGLINTNGILPRGSALPRIAGFEINVGQPISLEKYYPAYDAAVLQQEKDNILKIEEEATRELMRAIARLSRQEYPY